MSVLANSPDLSQQLESAQLALQSTFGDTSQKLIACVESYVSPSVQADGRLSQTSTSGSQTVLKERSEELSEYALVRPRTNVQVALDDQEDGGT